jgi:hypothetical protein
MELLSSLEVGGATILGVALWYWDSVGLRSMVVIEGIDRSTEAKRDTETEGCSETIATVGVVAFDGS